MKKVHTILLVLALLAVSIVPAFAAVTNPVVYHSWSPAGGAAAECSRLNNGTYMYAYKVDGSAPNDSWTAFGNTITISNSTGKVFDWSATNPIGAVIVKAGTGANVWFYNPQASSDTGLYAYQNKEVSHVTFCWNPEICTMDQTAWAAGPRYVEQGSWATYTPYVAGSTVNLYAGQHYLAGTVHFSPVSEGQVTITISFANGWSFRNVSENLKIQDYASAPSGNPSPGGFAHKFTNQATVTVPANNFYGIHLDVSGPCLLNQAR